MLDLEIEKIKGVYIGDVHQTDKYGHRRSAGTIEAVGAKKKQEAVKYIQNQYEAPKSAWTVKKQSTGHLKDF